jgi:hypothetical protein
MLRYAMRCDAMRCDAMRCDAMRCDAMRCDAMRCDAMQGRTIYWFKSVSHPQGQLEITEGARVCEYTGQDFSGGMDQHKSASAHQHAIVVQTPALQRAGVIA